MNRLILLLEARDIPIVLGQQPGVELYRFKAVTPAEKTGPDELVPQRAGDEIQL